MRTSGMITVADMMQILRHKLPNGKQKTCELVFVSANTQKGTGGQIRELSRVVLATGKRQDARRILIKARGLKHPMPVHIDLILYINNTPVA